MPVLFNIPLRENPDGPKMERASRKKEKMNEYPASEETLFKTFRHMTDQKKIDLTDAVGLLAKHFGKSERDILTILRRQMARHHLNQLGKLE